MNSVILRTTTVFILPLLLMLSLIVLLRGHNEPGGGFVGGLLASAAFTLYVLAAGAKAARHLLHVHPITLAGAGLLFALISGVMSIVAGHPLFDALWTDTKIIGQVKIGTPLLFDIGVYLTVCGVVCAIAFQLSESAEDARDPSPDEADPEGGTL